MKASSLLAGLVDFRRLDALAASASRAHGVAAEAKLLVTLVFLVCVSSSDRYAVFHLIPYAAFPIAMTLLGRLPISYIAGKVLLVLPVACLMALPNVLFDTDASSHIGRFDVSRGWFSATSIVLKAALAVSATTVLVATTGFNEICVVLRRLGVPRVLYVQLLFLYRYVVVLGEEAGRTLQAVDQRGGGGPPSHHTFGAMTGRLVLRTWERAERIHLAMCARGFSGEVHRRRSRPLQVADIVYAAVWLLLLSTLRLRSLSAASSTTIAGTLP